MSRAIDPFEEYLRKKKVELLERQYREKSGEFEAIEEPEEDEVDEPIASNEDPEQEAKVKEEAEEFFSSGQNAGAQLFQEMAGLDQEEVEEIRDALDEVFEEEAKAPQTEEQEDGQNFVSFFQEVQTEFKGPRPGQVGRPDPVEVVPEDDHAVGPPSEEEVVPHVGDPLPAALELEPDPADLEATAQEVSDAEVVEPAGPPRADEDRINLADVLLAGEQPPTLEKRVEVLCRLMVRVAERAGVTEAELIEALLKSDVDF